MTTGVTREGVAIMAERIISAFAVPIEFNSILLEIGVSIGIVLFPEHGDDGDELLRIADNAMYEAKRGRLDFTIPSVTKKQATQ